MPKTVTKLTYSQQLEVRRVESSAGVIAGSVTLAVEDGVEILSFDIETEPTVEPPIANVYDVERVHFIYRNGRVFGETAPTGVLCDRADFPRNVGHLCAGEPGCAAAPCLAIGGIQPLYERGGIEIIMVRLRDFMRDAKTGTLMAEGWEPVPFGIDQKFRPGEVSPKFFQNYALTNPDTKSAVGVAIDFEKDDSGYVILIPEVIEPCNLTVAIGERNKEFGPNHAIPWIFLWRHSDDVETDPIFEAWRTGAELRSGMERIGVEHAFDAAVGDLLNRDIQFRCQRFPQGGKALVVVLGVWRPAPIMGDFFGYSDDPSARKLELRAFLVMQEALKQIVEGDSRVEAIVGAYPPSPELFRWVAGVEQLPPIAMLGVGALGSAIFNNLARSGLADTIVCDNDFLYTHNLARHTARISDLYRPKVEHAETLIGQVARYGAANVERLQEDIVATSTDTLCERLKGRLIVDATADERVRLKMDELRLSSSFPIIRTEMFHEGRLGVTFVASEDGPTLSDMMLMLIAAAPSEPAVAAWLDHEARYPLGPDPMLYGFGCTSQTVRLANHVIELQASVATASILGDRSTSGVSLNPLDESFRPIGWRWLPIEPFTILIPATARDWSVRLSAEVVRRLAMEREGALPSETGGYLYGSWEPTRRVITIVYATPLPPESVSGTKELELAPAGRTAEERRLARKTKGRIFVCGTWHSHPLGPARMSARDDRAMRGHHKADAVHLRPTLIVIVGEDDIQAHLKVP